ncbi:MAG: flagellin [Hyphomicrobiales bacterium]|nr:flagellin [Hyphomicrobiales bacterium]MBV8440080.1 flagellin [Hyphomicrobiales bacterium]
MDSILNNSAALSALQALQMTQQSLATVQNQVSTGLSVASAADNSAYWSIAAQLNADSGIVTASNDALSEGQSVLATATSAINSVITTLNSMATALTQAQNPGAEIGDINTSLASLGRQLTDAVDGASFNGLNVLNGTQNTLSFVAGYNASATGGSVNTISFAAQALTGAAASTPTTTTTQSTITDPTTITNLAALYASPPTNTTLSYGNDVITASTTGPAALTVKSEDLYGNVTTTSYTALDASGNNSATDTSLTFATASSLAVSSTTTTAATSNLLTQGGIDLTGGTGATSTFQIGTTITASAALASVNQALAAVTNYSAEIGATQDRMTAATTFNSALTTNYSNGVSGLVDADMNEASTRLQALQTQAQLGIQSLSVANQNAQLILKLFGL